MKRALGLATLLTLSPLAAPAAGAETPDVPAKLAQCRLLDDRALRLACYDALADMTAPKVASTTLEATPAGEAPATAPTLADRFGAEDLPSKREERAAKQAETVTVSVVGLTFTHEGRARFELDNGQVWEQTDRMKARRFSLPYTAIISRASMGSYMIRKEDSGVTTRVKRIR